MIKKLIAAAVCLSAMAVNVAAFNFPTPDWGALLEEKTQMENEVDFELYVEGPVESAPYYGARLEPRGGTYFGMVAENSLFLPNVSSYLTYFEMGMDQTDIYYPANNVIREGEGIITVGYTVGSLSQVDYGRLRQSLDNLATYDKPVLIRFASEMNVSPLGDEPAQYIEVFRQAANIIHEYPNFAVVWSPNDLGALDRPFEYYYPGDEYVDWVGVSSYDKKYFQGNQNTSDKDARYFMTGDYAWTTNELKPIVAFMEKNNIQKPLMISEGGVTTENIYGENLDAWSSPRFRNLYYNTIMKYPQIKVINYFNEYREYEKEKYFVSDTEKAAGRDKEYAKYIMNEASLFGAYIQSGRNESDFVFERADKGSVLQAENGVVNLYTLAYIPKTPYITVTYKLDGTWYHSAEAAPYTCGLAVSNLADGAHTIEILSGSYSKKYTFQKQGNAICFGDNLPSQPAAQPHTDEIKVVINGEQLYFADVKPLIIEGRTLVPLRAIFEALDVDVEWDDSTKTVTAYDVDKEVSLTIGEKIIYINGIPAEIDVPAMIIDDRTMVPVRAVAQSLDCFVDWVADTRTVVIEN